MTEIARHAPADTARMAKNKEELMYPRLIIDLKKLKSNLDAVAHITKDQGGCSLMIVTKGLCADKEMAHMVAEHPAVDFVADSRVKNISTYADQVRKTAR